MSKSRFVLDKFARLIEQGLLSYKDLSDEEIDVIISQLVGRRGAEKGPADGAARGDGARARARGRRGAQVHGRRALEQVQPLEGHQAPVDSGRY